MESEGLLKCSQQPAFWPSPASDHSSAPNPVSWHPFWCLSSTSNSSKWSLPFRFSQHVSVHVGGLACDMACLFHHPSFDLLTSTSHEAPHTGCPRRFLCLMFRYLPQLHLVQTPFRLYTSFCMWDQASHAYKVRGKIIFTKILVL